MSQEKIKKILENYRDDVIQLYERGATLKDEKIILEQTFDDIFKVVMECLPIEHDVRPEITEWLVDKNRDEANGYNKAITDFKTNWEKKCEK